MDGRGWWARGCAVGCWGLWWFGIHKEANWAMGDAELEALVAQLEVLHLRRSEMAAQERDILERMKVVLAGCQGVGRGSSGEEDASVRSTGRKRRAAAWFVKGQAVYIKNPSRKMRARSNRLHDRVAVVLSVDEDLEDAGGDRVNFRTVAGVWSWRLAKNLRALTRREQVLMSGSVGV